MKGKKRLIWAVVFSFLLFFTLRTPADKVTADESECAGCHTNLKKLMDLSWEVKKIKPKKELSKENSGEG